MAILLDSTNGLFSVFLFLFLISLVDSRSTFCFKSLSLIHFWVSYKKIELKIQVGQNAPNLKLDVWVLSWAKITYGTGKMYFYEFLQSNWYLGLIAHGHSFLTSLFKFYMDIVYYKYLPSGTSLLSYKWINRWIILVILFSEQ